MESKHGQYHIAFAVVVLMGCANPDMLKNNQTDDLYESSDGIFDESDDPIESSGLDDLMDGLDKTYCDKYTEYASVPGATSYYFGSFLRTSNDWNGREKWILYPNNAWVETESVWDNIDEDHCEVTWDVQAVELASANCLACDFALNISASINRSQTNCPEGLWDYEEQLNWSTIYEVAINGSNSEVFFQSNGELLGEGQSDTGTFNYISEPDCKWF